MAQAKAIINIEVNTSTAAAQLRNLQNQVNSFATTLNKNNLLQAEAAQRFSNTILDAVSSTRFFTAESVRMETAARRLDQTLSKGRGTLGQYFSARFRKDSAEAASVLSLANSRAQALQTTFIETSAASRGFRDTIAIRPLAAFNTEAEVANQKLAIHRAMLRQATTSMINFGKNTQWAGRQLMVGFTVPLAIFGSSAAKTFKEIEQAAVRFKKVYGDAFTTPGEIEKNMKAVEGLALEFTKYGIAVSDTIALAAEAAAAGAQNAELIAATTEATRLATLGQMEQGEALAATIALQNAFRLSSKELATEVNFLNMVENQTVVTLQDLAEAIPRVAPVIVGLGGDVRDMAAMLAAMQEGGVSAAQGANALKSGLGSLINPTNNAINKLQELGININAIVQANRGDLMGTVQAFGQALATLDQFSRQQALEEVFGKYQYARLGALFDNIIKDGTQASRVLQIAGMSAEQMAKSAERELSVISEATSTKYMAAMERFKMAIAPIGELFMKISTPILNFFSKLFEMFDRLPDGVKNFAAIATVIVGVVVPAGTMFLGLFMNLIGTLLKFGNVVGSVVKGFGKGGLSGAIQAVSQSLNYMSLEEMDAANAATQFGTATGNANKALLAQITSADNATVAFSELATAINLAARAQQRYAETYPLAFAPGATAAKTAAQGPDVQQPFRPVRRNAGGTIPGFGDKDTVPAMLTPGEFVVNKKATEQNLPLLYAINNGGMMPGFNSGGGIAKNGRMFYGRYSKTAARRMSLDIEDMPPGPMRDRLQEALLAQGTRSNTPTQTSAASHGFMTISQLTGAQRSLLNNALKSATPRLEGVEPVQLLSNLIGAGPSYINQRARLSTASSEDMALLTSLVDFYRPAFTKVPAARGALANLGLEPLDAANLLSANLSERFRKMRSSRLSDTDIYDEVAQAFENTGLTPLYTALTSDRNAIRYTLPTDLVNELRRLMPTGSVHDTLLERAFPGSVSTFRDSRDRPGYVVAGSALGLPKDLLLMPGLTYSTGTGMSYEDIAVDEVGRAIQGSFGGRGLSPSELKIIRMHLGKNKGGMIPGVQYLFGGGLGVSKKLPRHNVPKKVIDEYEERFIRDSNGNITQEFKKILEQAGVNFNKDGQPLRLDGTPWQQNDYDYFAATHGSHTIPYSRSRGTEAFPAGSIENELITRLSTPNGRQLINDIIEDPRFEFNKNEKDIIKGLMGDFGEIEHPSSKEQIQAFIKLLNQIEKTRLNKSSNYASFLENLRSKKRTKSSITPQPVNHYYDQDGNAIIPSGTPQNHDIEIIRRNYSDENEFQEAIGKEVEKQNQLRNQFIKDNPDGGRFGLDYLFKQGFIKNPFEARAMTGMMHIGAVRRILESRLQGGFGGIPRQLAAGQGFGIYANKGGLIPGIQYLFGGGPAIGATVRRLLAGRQRKILDAEPDQTLESAAQQYADHGYASLTPAQRVLLSQSREPFAGPQLFRGAGGSSPLIDSKLRDALARGSYRDIIDLEGEMIPFPKGSWSTDERIAYDHMRYFASENQEWSNAIDMLTVRGSVPLYGSTYKEHIKGEQANVIRKIKDLKVQLKQAQDRMSPEAVAQEEARIEQLRLAVEEERKSARSKFGFTEDQDLTLTQRAMISDTVRESKAQRDYDIAKKSHRTNLEYPAELQRRIDEEILSLYYKRNKRKQAFAEIERLRQQGSNVNVFFKATKSDRYIPPGQAKISYIQDLTKGDPNDPLTTKLYVIGLDMGYPEMVDISGKPFARYGGRTNEYEFIRQNKGGLIPIQHFNTGGMADPIKAFATGNVFESGGRTIVPGVGNTDTVPAALTPGEFVINKKATRENLPLLNAINSGAVPGFNSGGMIGQLLYLQEGSQNPISPFSPQALYPSHPFNNPVVQTDTPIDVNMAEISGRDAQTVNNEQEMKKDRKEQRINARRMAIGGGLGAIGGALTMAPIIPGVGQNEQLSTTLSTAGIGLSALAMFASLPTPIALFTAGLASAVGALYVTRKNLDELARTSMKTGSELGGAANRMEKISQATGYQFASQRMGDRLFRFTQEEAQRASQFSSYFESDAGQAFVKELKNLSAPERYKEVSSLIAQAVADGMDAKTAKAYGDAIAFYTNDALLKSRIFSDFRANKYKSGTQALIDLILQREEELQKVSKISYNNATGAPTLIGMQNVGLSSGTEALAKFVGQQRNIGTSAVGEAAGKAGLGAAAGLGVGAAIGSILPGPGTAVGAVAGSIIGGLIGGIKGYQDYNKQIAILNENMKLASITFGAGIQVLKEVKNAEAALIEARREGRISVTEYESQLKQLRDIENRTSDSLKGIVNSYLSNTEIDQDAMKQALKDQLVISGFGGDLAEAVVNTVSFDEVAKQLFPAFSPEEVAKNSKMRDIVQSVMVETLSGLTPENAQSKLADIRTQWALIAQDVLNSVADGVSVSPQDMRKKLAAESSKQIYTQTRSGVTGETNLSGFELEAARQRAFSYGPSKISGGKTYYRDPETGTEFTSSNKKSSPKRASNTKSLEDLISESGIPGTGKPQATGKPLLVGPYAGNRFNKPEVRPLFDNIFTSEEAKTLQQLQATVFKGEDMSSIIKKIIAEYPGFATALKNISQDTLDAFNMTKEEIDLVLQSVDSGASSLETVQSALEKAGQNYADWIEKTDLGKLGTSEAELNTALSQLSEYHLNILGQQNDAFKENFAQIITELPKGIDLSIISKNVKNMLAEPEKTIKNIKKALADIKDIDFKQFGDNWKEIKNTINSIDPSTWVNMLTDAGFDFNEMGSVVQEAAKDLDRLRDKFAKSFTKGGKLKFSADIITSLNGMPVKDANAINKELLRIFPSGKLPPLLLPVLLQIPNIAGGLKYMGKRGYKVPDWVAKQIKEGKSAAEIFGSKENKRGGYGGIPSSEGYSLGELQSMIAGTTGQSMANMFNNMPGLPSTSGLGGGGGGGGAGQKSILQQLREMFKQLQDLYEGMSKYINSKTGMFKGIIAGPFGPQFIDYLRQQGEQGIALLKKGGKDLQLAYEEYVKIQRQIFKNTMKFMPSTIANERNKVFGKEQVTNQLMDMGMSQQSIDFFFSQEGMDIAATEYGRAVRKRQKFERTGKKKFKLNKKDKRSINYFEKPGQFKKIVDESAYFDEQRRQQIIENMQETNRLDSSLMNVLSGAGISPEVINMLKDMGYTSQQVQADLAGVVEKAKQLDQAMRTTKLNDAMKGLQTETQNAEEALKIYFSNFKDGVATISPELASQMAAAGIKVDNTQAIQAFKEVYDQLESLKLALKSPLQLEADLYQIQQDIARTRSDIAIEEQLTDDKEKLKNLQKENDLIARKIELRQRDLEPIDEEISKLDERKTKVREFYDAQLEALDEVYKKEEDLNEIRQGQLDIASALSRGDIAGAAQSALQLQQQMAQTRQSNARAAIEKARNEEIKSIDNEINDLKEKRKIIEEDIKELQKQQRVIQDDIYNTTKFIADETEKIEKEYGISESRIIALRAQLEGQLKTEQDILKAIQDQNAARNGAVVTSPTTPTTPGSTTPSPSPTTPAPAPSDEERRRNEANATIGTVPVSNDPNPNIKNAIDRINLSKHFANYGLWPESRRYLTAAKPYIENLPRTSGGYATLNSQYSIQDAVIRNAGYNLGGSVKYKGSREPAPGMMFGGRMKKFAIGSIVPGRGMTDKVPAMLTPGEFVIRKPVAEAIMPQLTALNGQIYPKMLSGINANTFPNVGSYGGTSIPKNGTTSSNNTNIPNQIQYNYSISVNAETNASAQDIADQVIYQIKRIDDRKIKGITL